MKTETNKCELSFHFIFFFSMIVISMYKNFEEQNDILQNDSYDIKSLRDLRPGWLLSRLKDISDVEWSSWKYFIKTSWLYMLLQFSISERVRRTYPSFIKHWYLLSSLIYLLIFMGVKQLIAITIQPVIFAFIVFFVGKKSAVWLSGILILMSYNYIKSLSIFWSILYSGDDIYEDIYLLLFGTAWNILRCISFSIDYIDAQEKAKKMKEPYPFTVCESLINMFSYVLYTPILYVGPMMLYEEYEASFRKVNTKVMPRLKYFFIDMVLYLTYSLILEISLHYMYFYAFQEKIELIKKMSSLALCGGGIWMGFQFYIKYLISYGTTAAYARLDNMDPPPTPRCIARIHVYSHMWRYFDVGLYRFLVKYLYKPAYTSLSEHTVMSRTASKTVASCVTFIFIYLWHGTTWNIFVWSVLNYLCILLEYTGKAIATTETYSKFKVKVLKTETNVLRFQAFVCSLLLMFSVISNFYLFGGASVGDLYFGLLNWPAWYNLLAVILTLYSLCHVAMSIADLPSRTDTDKVKHPEKSVPTDTDSH